MPKALEYLDVEGEIHPVQTGLLHRGVAWRYRTFASPALVGEQRLVLHMQGRHAACLCFVVCVFRDTHSE